MLNTCSFMIRMRKLSKEDDYKSRSLFFFGQQITTIQGGKKVIKRAGSYPVIFFFIYIFSFFLLVQKSMLSRSIKSVYKSPAYSLFRASSIAHYHRSAPLYNKKAAELKEEDSSPIAKFTQGMNVIKSTIFNAPPLRKITRPNIESLPFTGQSATWDQAVKEAQGLVNSADQERIFDPVKLIGADLWELKGNITKLLGSGHPFINTIGKHYLQGDTNRIRPLLVLLIAKATSLAPKQLSIDDSVTSLENPILPTQRRLAEISEMIYAASLLHYDVIDHADQVTNPGFGNKLAILAGDFLLARSSLALAQLRKPECIELIATCIAHLVESEFMKLEDIQDSAKAFDYYLDKSFKKTGSLIAQSCKASAVLAGCTADISQASYSYGKHLGIALQVKKKKED